MSFFCFFIECLKDRSILFRKLDGNGIIPDKLTLLAFVAKSLSMGILSKKFKKTRNTKDMKQNEETQSWAENEESQDAGEEMNTENPEQALPDAETAEADPLVKMEVELSEYKDKFLRLYSEFDNYKKRVNRDRIDQIKFASIETYLTFLPVIDDFERAQKSLDEATDVDSVKQGIQLIYQKFITLLESKGVKPMNCIGKEFDSELHESISTIPAPTPELKGKIIDEIEKGYMLNDKVIRHPKVIVGN